MSAHNEITKRLMESGEYEKMRTQLREKLRSNGWFDDVNQIALEELSGVEDPNFDKLWQKIEPKAVDMVSQDVKLETLKQIKQFLDTIVEKAP